MDTLKERVDAAFTKLNESGDLDTMVYNQVKETTKRALDDAIGTYSEFSKGLKKAIAEKLGADFSNLGIDGYNLSIMRIVKTQLDEAIDQAAAKTINETLQHMLQPAPAEMKLSELVEQMIEHHTRDEGGQGEITFNYEETDYGCVWINLDFEANQTKYRCDYRFAVSKSDGKVFGLKLQDIDVQKMLFSGKFYGFERTLFQLYSGGTKIELDFDNVQTSYGDY